MTAMASTSSKSFSHASIICPSCSAVPVARKSTGFDTDDPAKSFWSSLSAAGPDRRGISIPPSLRASVSITAGPPAWVTIAILLPLSGLYVKSAATVARSVRLQHLTTPAFRSKASTAVSGEAIAPVCDDAALDPASDEPALIAAILHPFLMSDDECLRNRCGSAMFSI